MHLALQLFTEASSEMVSMEGWLSNDTRSRLKINVNRSYGGLIEPPQSPQLNITETVWDHLVREQKKKKPTSKEELWNVFQEAWRAIAEDCLKK